MKAGIVYQGGGDTMAIIRPFILCGFFPSPPLRSLPSCLRKLWLLLIEHLSLKWVTAGIC